MSPIGVKACSVQCDGGWRGYYRIPFEGKIIDETIETVRKSSHDAWSDACMALKRWSVEHGVPLILEYHQLQIMVIIMENGTKVEV